MQHKGQNNNRHETTVPISSWHYMILNVLPYTLFQYTMDALSGQEKVMDG